MDIRLKSLELENFQGIQKFNLSPDGRSCTVYGRNRTGKTSLFNGFLFCYFNKDSYGNAKFDVKTLTPDGQPINKLEHAVDVTLEVDGKLHQHKKALKEVWTKRSNTMTGHTSDYWVDKEPVAEKKFKAAVAEIFDESVFRLLTDPMYFNSKDFHWTESRKILFQLYKGGDENTKLLMELEKQKAIAAEQKEKIDKERDEIPVRINEKRRDMPELSDTSVLEHERGNVKQEIIAIEQQKQTLLQRMSF